MLCSQPRLAWTWKTGGCLLRNGMTCCSSVVHVTPAGGWTFARASKAPPSMVSVVISTLTNHDFACLTVWRVFVQASLLSDSCDLPYLPTLQTSTFVVCRLRV